MTDNIFLVPVVFPEFRKSAENPIDLTEHNVKSTIINKLSRPKRTRVWGVKEGHQNRHYYKKMNKEDVLLFYNKGYYIYSGKVGVKFENHEISKHYWDNIPAKQLYSINNFQSIDLSKEVLNQACGYKLDYRPQSSKIVDTQPQWKLKQEYGSISNFLSEHKQ